MGLKHQNNASRCNYEIYINVMQGYSVLICFVKGVNPYCKRVNRIEKRGGGPIQLCTI